MLFSGPDNPKIGALFGDLDPHLIRWFFWPVRVPHPNGISIGLAIFTWITNVTNRPTDHATLSGFHSRDWATGRRPCVCVAAPRQIPADAWSRDAICTQQDAACIRSFATCSLSRPRAHGIPRHAEPDPAEPPQTSSQYPWGPRRTRTRAGL